MKLETKSSKCHRKERYQLWQQHEHEIDVVHCNIFPCLFSLDNRQFQYIQRKMIDGSDVPELVTSDRDLFRRVCGSGSVSASADACTYLMTHRIGNAIVSVNAFTFPNSNNTFANDCTIILHTVAIIFRFFDLLIFRAFVDFIWLKSLVSVHHVIYIVLNGISLYSNCRNDYFNQYYCEPDSG